MATCTKNNFYVGRVFWTERSIARYIYFKLHLLSSPSPGHPSGNILYILFGKVGGLLTKQHPSIRKTPRQGSLTRCFYWLVEILRQCTMDYDTLSLQQLHHVVKLNICLCNNLLQTMDNTDQHTMNYFIEYHQRTCALPAKTTHRNFLANKLSNMYHWPRICPCSCFFQNNQKKAKNESFLQPPDKNCFYINNYFEKWAKRAYSCISPAPWV